MLKIFFEWKGWLTLLSLSLMICILYAVSSVSVLAGDQLVLFLFLFLWFSITGTLLWRARQKRKLLVLKYLRDESMWKKRLRGGLFMLFIQSLVAFPLACVLLIMLSQGLGGAGWIALVLAVPAWVFLEGVLRKWSEMHCMPEASTYLVSSLTSRFLGFGLLIGLVMGGFWLPVDDVMGLSLSEAFYYGQADVLGQSSWLVLVAGYLQGLDGARLWLAQFFSLNSPAFIASLIVWFLVLVQGALFVVPVAILLQGTSLASSRLFCSAITEQDGHHQKKHFIRIAAPIFAILLPGMMLWDQLAADPWSWLTGPRQTVLINGDVFDVPDKALDKSLLVSLKQLDEKRRNIYFQLQGSVAQELDQVFEHAKENIPKYIDWHYSLKGSASRVAANFIEIDQAKAINRLFPEGGLDEHLQVIDRLVYEDFMSHQQQFADELSGNLHKQLSPWKRHPHRRLKGEEIHSDAIDIQQLYLEHISSRLESSKAAHQWGASLALGSAGALAIGAAASQAKMASRAVRAARVGSRSLAAFCVPAGPAAPVCAVAVFSVSTVAVEKIILTSDKYSNSDVLHNDLSESLDEMRKQILANYIMNIAALLATDLDGIRARVALQSRPLDYL